MSALGRLSRATTVVRTQAARRFATLKSNTGPPGHFWDRLSQGTKEKQGLLRWTQEAHHHVHGNKLKKYTQLHYTLAYLACYLGIPMYVVANDMSTSGRTLAFLDPSPYGGAVVQSKLDVADQYVLQLEAEAAKGIHNHKEPRVIAFFRIRIMLVCPALRL